jgi:transcriptional regulator with XRE-family HTH domain
MSRISKLTPKKAATIRELRNPKRKGGPLSLRAVGRELGISHQTVADWERAQKKTKRRVRGAARSAAKLLAEPVPVGVDAIVQRSIFIAKLLAKLAPSVEDGDFPAAAFVTLSKHSAELDRLAQELTPPEAKDPEQDPHTLESEAKFMAKLEEMITDAERRAAKAGKCPTCRGAP